MTITTAMEKIFVILTALQLTLLGCTAGNSIYRQPAIAHTNAVLSCGAAYIVYLEGSDKGQEFRQGLEVLAWSFRSPDGNYTFLGGMNSTGSVSMHSDPQKYAIGSKTGFLTIYNVAKADETEYRCAVSHQANQDSEPDESFVKLDVIEIPVTTSPTTESRNTSKYLPVDGKWSAWGAWSPCTKTCGHGTSIRERACNNPVPAYGGAACRSNTYEAQVCLVGHCSSKPSESDESSTVQSWVLTGQILVPLFIVSIAINLILARTYLKKCCLGLFENISGLFRSQNEILANGDVNHQNPTFEVPNCDGVEKSNTEENVPGTVAGGEIPLGIRENNTDNDVLRYNTLGL